MNDTKKRQDQYDLSEEGSKRSDEEATVIARRLESDDQGEGSGASTVSSPNDDSAENAVATSIDDE